MGGVADRLVPCEEGPARACRGASIARRRGPDAIVIGFDDRKIAYDPRMDIQLMPQSFRDSLSPIVAMVGILALGMAAPARADLAIELSTNGVNWSPVASAASGTAASYSSTFNGFNISVLSDDSNSPGETALAYLEGSALHVTNNNKGIATLYIKMSDTGFTSPLTSYDHIRLDSEIGGSVTTKGADNTLTFQSYVDPANGQSSLAGFTTGAQTPNITGTPKAYSTDTSMLITTGLTSTYSITEFFKITLDKGSQIGFQSSTTLAPAPSPRTWFWPFWARWD